VTEPTPGPTVGVTGRVSGPPDERQNGGMTALRLLPVPVGPEVLGILPDIESALSGGPALLPYVGEGPRPVIPPHAGDELPDRLALVIGTSGSTGTPKRALLTTDALLASAQSTHEVLGGPGDWLLALPAHHIAGFQVVVRSLVVGRTPSVPDSRGGFTAACFARSTAEMPADASRRYTSLVPTQLGRLLDDPAGLDALTSFDGVLVGGASTPVAMRERALAAGVRLVLTYGMSETAGGCVYDGTALPVSRIHLDNERHIVLGGDTVAHGYLADPLRTADAFRVDSDGVRWFRTDDLGHFDDAGLLVVDGRADDVINTGGLKITPGVVEDAIARHLPQVRDVVVLGLPDPDWGEIVCAALTLTDPTLHVTTQDLREQLRGILPDAALPRRSIVLPTIPHRGPGKPDRAALAHAIEEHG
jgi:O-succinylbenzoic acid--CoA ligase